MLTRCCAASIEKVAAESREEVNTISSSSPLPLAAIVAYWPSKEPPMAWSWKADEEQMEGGVKRAIEVEVVVLKIVFVWMAVLVIISVSTVVEVDVVE